MPSKIEWLQDPITGKPGFTINPVRGYCPAACSYCYARAMYDKFGWDKEIRFCPEVLRDVRKIKGKVFVGSTMELFGKWIDPLWMAEILRAVQENENITFLFLTKRPEMLSLYNPWPPNAWVGATATDQPSLEAAIRGLSKVHAHVLHISFEPLLGGITIPEWKLEQWLQDLDWIILGAMTGDRKLIAEQQTRYPELEGTPYERKYSLQPKDEWVEKIVTCADRVKVPTFIKDNLYWRDKRRSFPTPRDPLNRALWPDLESMREGKLGH